MTFLIHELVILLMLVRLSSTQSVRACFYNKHTGNFHGNSMLEPKDIDTDLCTHIVLEIFMVSPDLKLSYMQNDTEQLINQATELKRNKNSDVKLFMGILDGRPIAGGLTQVIQAGNASQREFINDIISILEKHSLDGVNIRYKWPDSTTKMAYASFLSFLKSVLDIKSKKRQQRWLMSVTLYPNGHIRDMFVYSELEELDILFVETTYQHGVWKSSTGHHSPLHHSSGQDLATPALHYKSKLPNHKLVFEIPLHGVTFRLKSESSNDVGANSLTNSEYKYKILRPPYYTICKNIRGGTYKFDTASKASYYYKGLDWVPVASNQERCHKLKWLYNNNLTGGWYTWISLDDAYGDCSDGPFPVLSYMINNSNSSILTEDCDSEMLKPNINTDCPFGKYGRLCRHKCSDNCDPPKTCDFITGICHKCQPGYIGERCNSQCDKGLYGSNCTQNCGGYCDPLNSCNHITGKCRCQVGYAPELCESKCGPRKYGDNCSQTCSPNCKTACDHISGVCRCPPGYIPDTCHEKCRTGTYGLDCAQLCGNCKGNDTCNFVTGECPHGCKPGFFGKFCVPCHAGFYGENCSLYCHCYKNYACDSKTGGCGRYGCKLHWFGEFCSLYDDHECTYNTWGVSCTDCGACKDGPCHRETGLCSTTGCSVNHYGVRCDVCNSDHFGVKCQHKCGHCYGEIPCEIKTGLCLHTCASGYLGGKCDLDCSTGRWGKQCEHRCSKNCNYGICSNLDGKCSHGCTLGSTSDRCDVVEMCVNKYDGPSCKHCDNCVSGKCEKVSGRCLLGCRPGYKGVRCAEACTHDTYGVDCINYCGLCKDYGQCDVKTGRCENGCTGYFMAPFCTECPVGHFGYECNQFCGNCVHKEICDSLTGACPSGCDRNFRGHYCKIRINAIVNFDI